VSAGVPAPMSAVPSEPAAAQLAAGAVTPGSASMRVAAEGGLTAAEGVRWIWAMAEEQLTGWPVSEERLTGRPVSAVSAVWAVWAPGVVPEPRLGPLSGRS
jgi:hypothetical protein